MNPENTSVTPGAMPDATPGATPTVTPPASATPAVTPNSDPTLDPQHLANITEEVKRLRAFKAKAEKEAQEREAASLSETEKAQKKAEQLSKDYAALQAKHQALLVTHAVEREAAKAKIVSPEAAVKLLDTSLIEYDDAGQPTNIAKLLKDLVAAYPFLKADETPAKPATPAPQAAMNPPRTQVVAPQKQFDYANRPRLGAIWSPKQQ